MCATIRGILFEIFAHNSVEYVCWRYVKQRDDLDVVGVNADVVSSYL